MSMLQNQNGSSAMDGLWNTMVGSYGSHKAELTLSELDIYGSKRLGVIQDTTTLSRFHFSGTYNPSSGSYLITGIYSPSYTATATTNLGSWYYGKKSYELTNHLGNVLATVSDRKLPYNNSNGLLCYNPDVKSETKYFSYGSVKDSGYYAGKKYNYGYQGSELNSGVEGTINTYYRQGNLETGTWLSTDPKTNLTLWESPYVLMGGNPILNNDVLGDVAGDYLSKSGEYLGNDGIDDKKVFVAEKKVVENNTKDGIVDASKVQADASTKKLSIDKNQLLNRAKWIWGEGGVNITEFDKAGTNRVSDYYAWTMSNLRNSTSVRSEDQLYNHMIVTDKSTATGYRSLYPLFKESGYNSHQKTFHSAMTGGFNNLYSKLPNSKFVIESIIKSNLKLNNDPTNGAFGWLGGLRPNTKNPYGERLKSAIILKTSDNYYHYFHKHY